MHPAHLLRFLVLGGFCCWLTISGFAQGTAGNAPISENELDNLVQGRLYSPNYFPIKGSPFLTKDWSQEDLRIQGNLYKDLPVWYDIFIDELILLNQLGAKLYFIRLNREHVEYFNLGDRRFINLSYSKFRHLSLSPGYYEQAFDDKITYLIKRSLELQEEDKTLINYFSRNDRRYLIVDGTLHRIRNQKTLLKVAGRAYKSDLSRFIKSEKIRFKKAAEEQWLTAIRYLNTLQSDRQ